MLPSRLEDYYTSLNPAPESMSPPYEVRKSFMMFLNLKDASLRAPHGLIAARGVVAPGSHNATQQIIVAVQPAAAKKLDFEARPLRKAIEGHFHIPHHASTSFRSIRLRTEIGSPFTSQRHAALVARRRVEAFIRGSDASASFRRVCDQETLQATMRAPWYCSVYRVRSVRSTDCESDGFTEVRRYSSSERERKRSLVKGRGGACIDRW